MQIVRNALLVGAAGVALLGFVGMAQAKPPVVHELRITLPGGAVETIRYTGNVAPKVSLSPGSTAAVGFMPLSMAFAPDPMFAEMDRISAMMDRQASVMMQQAQALSAMPNAPLNATFSSLPAGSEAYSFVSTMSGNDVCMRSVRVTYQGNKRNVQSSSSGHCPAGSAATMNLPSLATPSLQQTDTIEAKTASPVREVAYR